MGKSEKEKRTKNLIIVLAVGIVLFVASVFAIMLLRNCLAGLLSSDYFIDYKVYTEGNEIPTATEYLTNNGKLFAFCNGVASILVAAIFYLVGKRIYTGFFKKHMRVDLSKVIKLIEFLIAIFVVFSFTSRVNPDNNIKKYEVVFEPGSYEEVSKSYNQQGLELIGFAKKSELDSDKLLVPVYKTPSIESAPSTNGFQAFMLKLVRNIGVIGNYAEMFTVALGVCLLVLNHYQKLFDEYYKER